MHRKVTRERVLNTSWSQATDSHLKLTDGSMFRFSGPNCADNVEQRQTVGPNVPGTHDNATAQQFSVGGIRKWRVSAYLSSRWRHLEQAFVVCRSVDRSAINHYNCRPRSLQRLVPLLRRQGENYPAADSLHRPKSVDRIVSRNL